MKKVARYLTILALCALILGVMLFFAPKPFTSHISALPQGATVNVYCRNTSLPSTNMGNGYLVSCKLCQLNDTLGACKNVDGISVSFFATQGQLQALLQSFDVKVTSTYQDGNLLALSGYSNKILGGINIDGNLVNLQLAYDGTTLTIGYPLILDSY